MTENDIANADPDTPAGRLNAWVDAWVGFYAQTGLPLSAALIAGPPPSAEPRASASDVRGVLDALALELRRRAVLASESADVAAGSYANCACVWPACLTEAQHLELSENVHRSMLGEENAGPDPEPDCDCPERKLAEAQAEVQRLTVELAHANSTVEAFHQTADELSDRYDNMRADWRAAVARAKRAEAEVARLRETVALLREGMHLSDQQRNELDEVTRSETDELLDELRTGRDAAIARAEQAEAALAKQQQGHRDAYLIVMQERDDARNRLRAETAVAKELLQRNVELGTRADAAETALAEMRERLAEIGEATPQYGLRYGCLDPMPIGDGEVAFYRAEKHVGLVKRDVWRSSGVRRTPPHAPSWSARPTSRATGEAPTMSKRTANLITAPFTRQQVTALNAYQTSGQMHPFTCGGKRRFGRRCVRVLIATPDGWRCPRWTCTYRQDWAHGWMATPDWTPKGGDGDD